MFNLFKKEKELEKNNISVISLASLLIHAARIDESYTENESKIIKETMIKLGANNNDIDDIIKKAEVAEKNSNQILEFTQEAKNLAEKDKLLLVEALWDIIYSDKNVDMYESNLMRRLSGLLYLDKRQVGDIQEKIKNKNK
mgnify:CR=1 FL=1|tara:strand:+ start:73 stop:495 length:423 start_codon:yes stop_codon:yes gene_type:complete